MPRVLCRSSFDLHRIRSKRIAKRVSKSAREPECGERGLLGDTKAWLSQGASTFSKIRRGKSSEHIPPHTHIAFQNRMFLLLSKLRHGDTWRKVKSDTSNPEMDPIWGCLHSGDRAQAGQLNGVGGQQGGGKEDEARWGMSSA